MSGTNDVKLRIQSFGENPSAIATASIVSEGVSFRYFRCTEFVKSGNTASFIGDVRFWSGGGGTGTGYPAYMTSMVLPTPYVISASYTHSAGYAPWKAVDNGENTSGQEYSGWWLLGLTDSQMLTAWLDIDMGSTRDIASIEFNQYTSSNYLLLTMSIYGSSTGAFAGEETLIVEDWAVNQGLNANTILG
jgi:hypothetical protein